MELKQLLDHRYPGWCKPCSVCGDRAIMYWADKPDERACYKKSCIKTVSSFRELRLSKAFISSALEIRAEFLRESNPYVQDND